MHMILTTEGLTKQVRGDTLIENVCLHVPRGKVYGFLGPNGAGKSTTLKCITGIMRPTEGTILFDGHPMKRTDLIHVGSLIEQPSLYGNLDARNNLRVQTRMLGIPESRIETVLDMVGLEDTGKKKASRFSMGMKQRLGLAMALLNAPKLLILDEPSNGLDPIGIQELRDLIRHFAEGGTTVLLSSHILAEVEQVADYIGIIDHGQLVYQRINDKTEDLEQVFNGLVRR